MPLPTGDISWPPTPILALARDWKEWAAWYAGDTASLASLYGASNDPNARGARTPAQPSLYQRLRFWGRRDSNEPQSRMRYHVPAASDVAATSADLLFGDEPTIRFAKATNATTNPTQDRFDEIRDRLAFDNILLEGAEVCAALGGSYLRPSWDKEVSDLPMLDVFHADCAIPEFRGDVLWAVTFHNVVAVDGGRVWRKLERHERGVILTGLYLGTSDRLGSQVPLNSIDATTDLIDVVPLPVEMADRILVSYVPNVRPHRRLRSQPQGRADFMGTESLMDALDETYSSWMRDIRLGQSRLVVGEDALSRGPRGTGAGFDGDQEIFTKLNADPKSASGGLPIEVVQFTIRAEEHKATATALFEKIVTNSGYSPQSYGLDITGQAESGSALRVREGKTLKTRSRKARYWTPAIAKTIENVMLIDRYVFGRTDVEPSAPTVTLADAVVNDPMEQSQTISMLRQAEAISRKTAVKMAQPELDDTALDAEVALIEAERSVSFDPTGGIPQ